MHLLLTVLLLVAVTTHAKMFTDAFPLIERGIPQATIILPESANAPAQVRYFNQTLQKVYGCQLPVVTPAQSPLISTRRRIILVCQFDPNPWQNDSFNIDFPEVCVMRIRCTHISLPWALNHLLEEYAGVQWLFPEACGLSFTPKGNMNVPRKTITQSPSFPLKRMVENTHASWYPKGRFKDGVDMNHMLLRYVFPMEKYEKEGWPPNIMPLLNGKKLKRPPIKTPNALWQPCYSHPDTTRLAVENICQYMEKHPEQRCISLMQNDVSGFCQCNPCKLANGGDHYEKSQVYFRWVNRVAEKVAKRFPNLLFTAGAYVDTKEPPTFKLHDQVVIILTLDLYQCVDPTIMAKRKQYIESWSHKAKHLGVWDYAWGHGYVLPRVYYHVHAHMLKFLHEHNVRVYFSENECFDAKEGPKEFLVSKLLWNIDADVDQILDQWYDACLGSKAAPYLKKYYQFWENFMAGPEIKKTPWFKSVNSVYMTWDSDKSHMYAVSGKIMEQARSLMEKACQYAATEQEKQRAELLSRHFNYMDTILKLYGAELLPPENILNNEQTALNMIRNFKNLPLLLAQRESLSDQFERDPVMGSFYKSRIYGRRLRLHEPISTPILWQLGMAMDFIQAPKVRDALMQMLQEGIPHLDAKTHELVRALTTPTPGTVNLFPNGSLETPVDEHVIWLHPEHRKKGSGRRTRERAYHGQYAWKIIPDAYSLVRITLPAKPSTRYLLSLKLFSEDHSGVAESACAIYPTKKGNNQAWRMLPRKKLVPERWQKQVAFVETKPDSDGISGFLFLENFTPGKALYIDDISLFQLH